MDEIKHHAHKPDAPPAPVTLLTAEQWGKKKGTALWLTRGAMAGKKWDEHMQITEADFDAAVEWVANIRIG